MKNNVIQNIKKIKIKNVLIKEHPTDLFIRINIFYETSSMRN